MFQDSASDGATVVQMLVPLPASVTPDAAGSYLFRLVTAPSIIFDNFFQASGHCRSYLPCLLPVPSHLWASTTCYCTCTMSFPSRLLRARP